MNEEAKASKLTKIIIHKVHGGRKKDSKFWNDDIYLDRDIKKEIQLKKKKRDQSPLDVLFKTLVLCLPTIAILIVVKPDLFPFLDYHKVYKSISNTQKIEQVSTVENNQIEPQEYSIKPAKSYSNTYRPVQIDLKNKPDDNLQNTISLSGNVFSWKDEKGKRHFSNTNYPLNNPTLQVQTEINTYKKITKISVQGNRIYVPVILKNNGKSITTWMLLDTGCSITNIPYRKLNKIDPEYNRPISLITANGSKNHGKTTNIDLIQIGSQRERNFTVAGTKIAGSDNKGLLGLDFLKRRPFKIDYDKQMLVWM